MSKIVIQLFIVGAAGAGLYFYAKWHDRIEHNQPRMLEALEGLLASIDSCEMTPHHSPSIVFAEEVIREVRRKP